MTVTERYDRAWKMLVDLCSGKERWTMRVPAEPDRDSDLVIGASLDDVPKLRDHLDNAAHVLDLWLTGDEDLTEDLVRATISGARELLDGPEPGPLSITRVKATLPEGEPPFSGDLAWMAAGAVIEAALHWADTEYGDPREFMADVDLNDAVRAYREATQGAGAQPGSSS